jgi:hypothetical protein
MLRNNVDSINNTMLKMMCGRAIIHSKLGIKVGTESRMIKMRKSLLPQLLVNNSNVYTEKHCEQFKECIALSALIIESDCVEGGKYKDWFSITTTQADWVSFFKHYNVFSIWDKKDWNNKKIRLMRKLMSSVFITNKKS